jgi:rhamnosyl/mannosyltransferase
MAVGSDVLHAHMPDPMSALAVWVTRPSARLVLHWHSDVIRQRRAMKLYRPLQTWLLRRSDAIIATSRAYLEASEPLQPWKHKVRVIPIGIADRESCADREKVDAIRQRFAGKHIVFALGRMTYYKGFEQLVDAAALLPPEAAVLIGGTGNRLCHLAEQVAQRGLGDRVHLLGDISDLELPSYFAACDVFCLPSTGRAEAFGIAMIEAMMMGKPVVAADIPGSGVPWINVDGVTGLNVPVRQPAALAGALALLMSNDELRQRMGHAARRRYLDEFTAERMTQRTIDLYRQSMKGPLG